MHRRLLIRVSTRPNCERAVSTRRSAVAGSPIFPATVSISGCCESGMVRELAIMREPLLRYASTKPAPTPRDAPVMIAIFSVLFFISVYSCRPWSSRHLADDFGGWTCLRMPECRTRPQAGAVRITDSHRSRQDGGGHPRDLREARYRMTFVLVDE